MKIIIPLLALAGFLWLCHYSLDKQQSLDKGYTREQVSQLNKLMDAQEPEPVILIPNEEMRRDMTIIDLYTDDGQPVNETIRERQARAAARDNHLPMARRVYAAR